MKEKHEPSAREMSSSSIHGSTAVLKILVPLQLRTEWDIFREKEAWIDGRGGGGIFVHLLQWSLFIRGGHYFLSEEEGCGGLFLAFYPSGSTRPQDVCFV